MTRARLRRGLWETWDASCLSPAAVVNYVSPPRNLIEESATRSLKLRQAILETLRKANDPQM